MSGDLVINRRALVAGLIATTAAGSLDAKPDPRARIREVVTELLALMHEVHGGPWLAEVDHDAELILLVPQPTNPAPPPPSVVAALDEEDRRRAADPQSGFTLTIG
jgi:hypothetical protein